jgi:hypothetical protein
MSEASELPISELEVAQTEREILHLLQKLAETSPAVLRQQLGYFENLVDWDRFERVRLALVQESERGDNLLLQEAAAMIGVVISAATLAGLYAPLPTASDIATDLF